MKITNFIFIPLLILSISACTPRSDLITTTEDIVKHSKKEIVFLPKIGNSDKRSLSDITCDGFNDMIEFNDSASFFSFNRQETFNMNVFKGYKDNGVIKYENPVTLKLDVKNVDFVDAFKIDTANLNGDECRDIVFSSVIERNNITRIEFVFFINKGNLVFERTTNQINFTDKNNEFQYWFNELVKEISYDSESSIYDYLKIDWSDFDGNGTDDLALFVDDSNNLDLGIFYTNAADHNMPTFTNMKNFYIENYLHGLNIINLRTFDANGDGLADISIPHTFDSNSFSLSFLINTNNSEFRFNKDIQFTRPKNIDFFIKAEKYEFADENNDGIEDFIQITEIDNKPAKIVYFLESI